MDITDRHLAEERFRELAENIPQLAWMVNADGWIFRLNKRWYEYTGTTLEQMRGWGWQAVHHPDHTTVGFFPAPFRFTMLTGTSSAGSAPTPTSPN